MNTPNNELKNTIRAIIFDWAGVFCSPGEPFSHPELIKQTRLTLDEFSSKTADVQQQYYCGEISSEDFWRSVIKRFMLNDISQKELSEAYLASYRIYPEMLEFAQKLKDHFPTALLSNLTQEMMDDIIKKYHIDQYFHYVIFSNQVGMVKPNTEIFNIALRKLGTKASETLFIDDSMTNIQAAKSLGFHTILFTSPQNARQEILSNLSVDFEV